MSTLTKELVFQQLDSSEPFPISLEDANEWLGYTYKGNQVRSLKSSGLTKDVDYMVFITNDKNGRPREDYFLTIDGFKQWCMMAKTDKGKETRLFYLRIEREYRELKAQKIAFSAAQVKADEIAVSVRDMIESNPVTAIQLVGTLNHLAGLKVEGGSTAVTEQLQLLEASSKAANRMGLSMNKHLKFFDQIVDLTNPESVLKLTNDYNELAAQNNRIKAGNGKLHEEIDGLNAELDSLRLEVHRLNTKLQEKSTNTSREKELKQEVKYWKSMYEELQTKYRNATQRQLPLSNRFLLPGS